MHVAIIGGASTIGSTVAYTLASADPTFEITLVDKAEEPAWAHAVDVTHSVFHTVDAPVDGETAGSLGTVRAVGADEIGDLDPQPDLAVFTAAAPRPDDATDTDAREAELEANRGIVDDVAEQLRSIDPIPILVMTNPIDRITYRLWRRLEWPRGHFLGYSLSETARTAHRIGELRDVDPETVYCPVMGEHGNGIVPIFSKLRIDGEPATLSADERADVREYVREIPFEIAKRRGAAETSRWVTSAGTSRLIRTIADGGSGDTGTPVCLSTPVDGEYGLSEGCLSVPVTLSADGADEILEWDLADDERERLAAAHERIRSDLQL
ncbi:malate dehydrogenase [Natronolimnohabitans innermongolicus]|uniref:malate dehydrogenase n=1 Tax=Natronolimnohabitans innermongolicus JCM 12255 TaxID=1227499 RepID=L9WNH6_9EURY|nr:malate dehydrogenase [Natronolimnohabitans innermongolicus]ELY50947.1 malate dehydrogenase [Natronolimnohabitans innermongolicus JCM 12255]